MNRRRASDSQAATVLLGAAAIVAVAICLGVLANHLSPHGVPLFASEESLRPRVPAVVTYVGLDEARARLGEPGVIFLDARPAGAFAEGHVRGALSLPADSFAEAHGALQDKLRAAVLLVCYCEDMMCEDAARLTELLSDAGYRNVALMFEGWEGWRAAGYPSSSGEEAHP